MITGNLYHGMTFEAYKIRMLLPQMAKHLIKIEGISDDKPLQARINHGRWIVDCECGGAELAWNEGLFMCQSCWNAKHKHQLRSVVFPRNRSKIELILMVRPEPNRNWYPGEALAQLEAENKAHKEELL